MIGKTAMKHSTLSEITFNRRDFGKEVTVFIHTFILIFDEAMLCYYSNGANCNPMENRIQETICNYCLENNVVECDREITTIRSGLNDRFTIAITSKFESKT